MPAKGNSKSSAGYYEPGSNNIKGIQLELGSSGSDQDPREYVANMHNDGEVDYDSEEGYNEGQNEDYEEEEEEEAMDEDYISDDLGDGSWIQAGDSHVGPSHVGESPEERDLPEEDWERMEAKERESSKKPAPTSYLDGL